LLTTRARQLLACADVVVTDQLVPPGALAELPADVQVVEAGKLSGHHPVPQERIDALLVELAAGGRGVVRLKGDGPSGTDTS
jgi:uroporphyrin-III C-methyltransferase/precorrin-2 dehydrogenase/sirohydrochlorin ferrochelatase